jgi:hypothetical protein
MFALTLIAFICIVFSILYFFLTDYSKSVNQNNLKHYIIPTNDRIPKDK